MKFIKMRPIFLFGTLILLFSLAVVPQAAMAKTLVCGLPGTPPCPPSGGDSGGSKPGPKNRSTPVPTPAATETQTTVPSASGGSGSNNSNGSLPAVQNPGQGSLPAVQNPGQGLSSSSMPGPLGMLIALLIIVVCIGGGVFLFRRGQISGNGKPGLSPFTKIMDTEMNTIGGKEVGDFGGNENFTITKPDLKGSNENFTISGKNINNNSEKW